MEERANRVKPWLRLWWGEILTQIIPSYWFKQKRRKTPLGTTDSSGRDGIRVIYGSKAPVSLKVSTDVGPSTNESFVEKKDG